MDRKYGRALLHRHGRLCSIVPLRQNPSRQPSGNDESRSRPALPSIRGNFLTVGPKIAAAARHVGATCRRCSAFSTSSCQWRGVVIAALGVISSLLAVEAAAIGLGQATVSSGLGEPLRMSIPVSLQSDEEIGCVQVRPHGDDLPAVFNTRSQVLRSGTQTRIEIRSPLAVDEPAIGIVVSVGCASPVARDYVLFLDPPMVGAQVDSTPATALVTTRAPRARAPASDAPAATARTEPSTTAPPRPARRRAPAPPTPSPRPEATTARAATMSPSDSRPRQAAGGDRLSVMPTEPPVIGRTSPTPRPGFFPPPVTGTAPLAPAVPAAAAVASPAVGAPVTTPMPAAAPADLPAVDTAALAREEALRQQQVALQLQITNLGDQIASLRVQATSLAVRNQALEGTTMSPLLMWLLIALALVAIIVAGWMAWRYTQLRRSLEESAWWTGQAATSGDGPVEEAVTPGAVTVPARTTNRPTAMSTAAFESRPQSPPATAPGVQISNIDRIRPPVRAPGSSYPAAMDTDFTVSDIEAAMATVRTVSPPRKERPANPLEDSDFSGLGGPAISLFSEAPPSAAKADDEAAHFVDLDIPAMQVPAPAAARTQSPVDSASTAPAASSAPSFDGQIEFTPRSQTSTSTPLPAGATVDEQPGAGAATDLAFRLDIPDAFDPLAPDNMKATVFDRGVAHEPDFEAGGAPTSLDFELPSQTQIAAMTTFDRTQVVDPVRHGATALHDLFAPLDVDAPDTTLDFDAPDGGPLSTTEVDRFTGLASDPTITVAGLSGRGRMARFGDMVAQLDELATTDPLAAIARLRQYVLREESIPTLLWLRLFELYKVVDKRPVYDALADHFARRYHRPMVAWSETLADRAPQSPLSALAEIDRRVEALWGTDAGIQYIETLLCDRTQEDAVVFNAVLQKDLLDAAKIFPDRG